MRKTKSKKSTDDKKSSEESESIVETTIEAALVPESPKPNINVLDENNQEQHVEINAKSYVVWPFVKDLGAQVNTLKLKKMLKVHPFIPEE